ncbi:MAG: 3-deoxy-7-phosphoheptulonate synthase [Patescibacteria group bacterium]
MTRKMRYEKVIPVMKHQNLVKIGHMHLGGCDFKTEKCRPFVIAGPCSVEGLETMEQTARSVQSSGATALRGGAFKPRTSPYEFRGMQEEGLKILREVSNQTNMPVVTEAMDTRHVDLVASYADAIQIGARNMQNFALLEASGATGKPVLLKRGPSATIKEFLLAAEYIMNAGSHDQVILCERGLRSFDSYTRNLLDISAVPVLQSMTDLPVIVDPSHAAGRSDIVPALCYAAIAAGANGLIVEVHPNPRKALTDGDQSLNLFQFRYMMYKLELISACTRSNEGGYS